jgi:hypothetical protein
VRYFKTLYLVLEVNKKATYIQGLPKRCIHALTKENYTFIRHTSHDLIVMRVATSVEKTPYYVL